MTCDNIRPVDHDLGSVIPELGAAVVTRHKSSIKPHHNYYRDPRVKHPSREYSHRFGYITDYDDHDDVTNFVDDILPSVFSKNDYRPRFGHPYETPGYGQHYDQYQYHRPQHGDQRPLSVHDPDHHHLHAPHYTDHRYDQQYYHPPHHYSTPAPYISHHSTPAPYYHSSPSASPYHSSYHSPTPYHHPTTPYYHQSTPAPYYHHSYSHVSTPAPVYHPSPAPFYTSTPSPYYHHHEPSPTIPPSLDTIFRSVASPPEPSITFEDNQLEPQTFSTDPDIMVCKHLENI